VRYSARSRQAFHEIFKYILGDGSTVPACGIDIPEQFRPGEDGHFSVPGNINASFLLALSGKDHPRYEEARQYLDEMEKDPLWTDLVVFYKEGLELLLEEFQGFRFSGRGTEIVKRLTEKLKRARGRPHCHEIQEELWGLFHPEAANILKNKESRVKTLRGKRKIRVTRLNPRPIRDVSKEVLFTANVLLTVPPAGKGFQELDISPNLLNALEEITREEQLFWYDHPVQIGVEPAMNEILYGLSHLSRAFLFEKKAKNVDKDGELSCVLSASVTHEGLQGIVKEYIEYELTKAHNLPGLKLYLLTEADTARLIHEILVPAARRYIENIKNPAAMLREVVGVDGRYGRHYSFLKAIAAFWQVVIEPGIRATFKTDLDQVFPQENLLKETGKSAFEHLMTPLWGAYGIDSEGDPTHLGMIAGALVNKRDIRSSLFTPDVTYPSPPFKGEDMLFCSKIPQALSTASEMMTRYTDADIDGKNYCISRIHVTGGTNGITIDALRRYRPFTPIFINRAEDQAYLLSVLFPPGTGPALRYVHEDGLFMKHDKEAFSGEAVRASAIGKLAGDYERTIFFSYYAKALPWDVERTKGIIDPFTGSFVSPLPFNLAYLRMSLKAAEFFSTKKEEDGLRGLELVETGSKRLKRAIQELSAEGGRGLERCYKREKEAWDLYYDILDEIEDALKRGDPFAVELKKRGRGLVNNARVVTEREGFS
jgi:hypothetical protein